MKHLNFAGKVFTFRRSVEEGQFRPCECCGYPAPVTLVGPAPTPQNRRRGTPFTFCRLCYGSRISSHYNVYGGVHEEDADRIASDSAYAANAVLDQMGAFDGAEITEIDGG